MGYCTDNRRVTLRYFILINLNKSIKLVDDQKAVARTVATQLHPIYINNSEYIGLLQNKSNQTTQGFDDMLKVTVVVKTCIC